MDPRRIRVINTPAFKTHNDAKISTRNTSLRGYVTTTYDRLVEVFGAPMENEYEKTTAEWIVRFDDGAVATIYDYKDPAPRGSASHLWHVGGFPGPHGNNALERVRRLVGIRNDSTGLVG